MKSFVIGDIHGGLKALDQCIERSSIHPQKDRLICLGDVADGWPETYGCFERLLEFKNLVYIIGNHDAWLLNYFETKRVPPIWYSQGGKETLVSYLDKDFSRHHELLKNSLDYFIDERNNLFIHGGFNTRLPIDKAANRTEYRHVDGGRHSDYNWDREMWYSAVWHTFPIEPYRKIFIGHTSTSRINNNIPQYGANVWNLDQGAGWDGNLTIMNVDTEEYWQSDRVKTLYPKEKGR